MSLHRLNFIMKGYAPFLFILVLVYCFPCPLLLEFLKRDAKVFLMGLLCIIYLCKMPGKVNPKWVMFSLLLFIKFGNQ